MSQQSVYFVGTPREVAHHAAPFADALNVTIIDPSKVVEVAQPDDLVIFYSEHFDRFRAACRQLRTNNVATLYMIDGILEWRNAWENRDDEVACPYAMRPVLAHKVACIGDSQARILDSWGNVGKTEVVGIPRLESFQRINTQTNEPGAEFRVLIMTAKTPGFTPEQVETVRRSLLDLKSWQADNPALAGREVKFVWRLTGGLEEEIGVENELSDLTGAELATVLQNVDAVVATPSTAILEAMLYELPVAVLDYHNCPHYVSAGWDICSPEHIDSTMRQLVERPETRMMFQRQLLSDALCMDSPTDRFCSLVNEMLTTAAKTKNETLEFEPNLLAPPAHSGVKFEHVRLYPKATEFGENDTNLLQVELSHARREIEHLHREMAQLQSELDQAHQIFEQIETHPIAGPVVRIRQKMLDLMASIKKRKTKMESQELSSRQNVGKMEG